MHSIERHPEVLTGAKTRRSAPYLKSLTETLVSGIIAGLENAHRLGTTDSQQAARRPIEGEPGGPTVEELQHTGWKKVHAIRHGALHAGSELEDPPAEEAEPAAAAGAEGSPRDEAPRLTPHGLERQPSTRPASRSVFTDIIIALELLQQPPPTIGGRIL